MKNTPKKFKSARALVRNRLERLADIEARKPGAIRATPMTWAFIRAIQKEA